ncbi:MAG: hypothetical protein JST16_05370 [Bdellovibrionales bacterium]|nr:hypothetical protein [Bdellovibrionales bacterium]
MTAVKLWIVLFGELLCASAIAQSDLSAIMQAQAMKERAEARFQQRMQICNSYIMTDQSKYPPCADNAQKSLQAEVRLAVQTMNAPAAKDEPKMLWESPSHNMFIQTYAAEDSCRGIIFDRKGKTAISGVVIVSGLAAGWIFNYTGQRPRSIRAKIDGKTVEHVAGDDGSGDVLVGFHDKVFSGAKALEISAQFGHAVVEKTFDLADLPALAENLKKICTPLRR